MAVTSPVSERLTVVALLLLTFATGLADSISILVLGHVFVANMTGNVIFLGFWLAPRTNIDLTAVVVALPTFVCTTILSGRLSRHFGDRTRRWITTVLATEIVVLVALSILAGTGVLRYHDNTKLIMIGILAVTFGLQHSSARQFGIQELSTTVLTSTIVSLGLDSRLAGGTGARAKTAPQRCFHDVQRSDRRRDDVTIRRGSGVRAHGGGGGAEPADLPIRAIRYERTRS